MPCDLDVSCANATIYFFLAIRAFVLLPFDRVALLWFEHLRMSLPACFLGRPFSSCTLWTLLSLRPSLCFCFLNLRTHSLQNFCHLLRGDLATSSSQPGIRCLSCPRQFYAYITLLSPVASRCAGLGPIWKMRMQTPPASPSMATALTSSLQKASSKFLHSFMCIDPWTKLHFLRYTKYTCFISKCFHIFHINYNCCQAAPISPFDCLYWNMHRLTFDLLLHIAGVGGMGGSPSIVLCICIFPQSCKLH